MTGQERTPTTISPLRVARKVVVAVIGVTVLAVGVALIVLPGPAVVVIPLGLSILATEFLWARRLLRRVKSGVTRLFGHPNANANPTRLYTGRPLLVAMVTVVGSFLGSLWFSHYRLAAIEDETLVIAENAAPSIKHLASARAELRRLGMYANEYPTDVAENNRPVSRKRIDSTWTQLRAEFAAQRALPSAFPGEQDLESDITRNLERLDILLRKALDEADRRDFDSARITLHREVHHAIELSDQSMQRLVDLNVAHVREATVQIAQVKRHGMKVALVLGAGSLLAAVGATLLAWSTMRQQARLIEEHKRLVEARSAELDLFAGRVAHDLKNPLGAIALRIMVAQRLELDAKLRDTFGKVAGQVERMDHIIDGLLEFALAGANPPPGARAEVQVVLDEVVSDLRPAAEETNTELRIEPFPSTSVACTPGALMSVISNMLRNAVKYIVEGEQPVRRISVRVKTRDDTVRVEMEDTGPGMPPGTERLVFEPFQRLPGTRQPGTGLGLATVKKIIEAYKGGVGVRSTLGQGSLFWFELPKAPMEEPALSPLPALRDQRSPQEAPGFRHARS